MNRTQLKMAHDLAVSLESIERALKSVGRPSTEDRLVVLEHENGEHASPPVRINSYEWVEWLTSLRTKRVEALEKLGVKP